VQPDGGLVQHIEHAAQLRADLRGQADALRLAARKRSGGAFQAQVIQPHGRKKFQAPADFVQHPPGDLRFALVEFQLRTVTSARAMGSEVNSAMEKFLTRTERLAGRSRLPLQAAQSRGDM
jgi:hypothetical protein